MYIAPRPPFRFATGDVLAPSDVNTNNNYFLQAASAVDAERAVLWSSSYSLPVDAFTPLTSASDAAYLTRGIPPQSFRTISGTGSITGISAAVTTYYTASVPFTLTVYPGHAGAITITFPARAAAYALVPYTVTELFNVNLTTETAALVLAPSVGASITVMDVELGWRADRYVSGDLAGAVATPSIPETLGDFTDATIGSAAVFSGLQSTIEALATAVRKGAPCRWAACELVNIFDTATAQFRRVPLGAYDTPAFGPVELAPSVVGVYVDAVYSASGGTVSYGVADFNGTFTAKFNNVALASTILQSGVIAAAGAFQLTTDFAAQITVPAGRSLTRATIYVIFQ
jgi:hypothetical protein